MYSLCWLFSMCPLNLSLTPWSLLCGQEADLCYHTGPSALRLQIGLGQWEEMTRRLEHGEKRYNKDFMARPCCGSERLQYSETTDLVTKPLLPFLLLAPSDLQMKTASTIANPSGAQHPFLVPLMLTTPLQTSPSLTSYS